MNIRATTPKDIDAVMAIIEEARGTIAALGIDQWQNGSPNRAMIEEDIALGQGYCVEAEGAVIGTFALLENGEPTYDPICDGEWQTPDHRKDGTAAYLAIHRVAISVACRGSGISTAIINHAADTARRLGRGSLRIDTHRDNAPMRRALEKYGFAYCGIIHLASGDARIAFHKTRR